MKVITGDRETERELAEKIKNITGSDDPDLIHEDLLYCKFKAMVQHEAKMMHERHMQRVRGELPWNIMPSNYTAPSRYTNTYFDGEKFII